MVADEDGATFGRGFFGMTTILAGLSFHDLQLLKCPPGEELLEILNSNIEIRNKSEFSNYQMFQTVLLIRTFEF